MLAAPAAGASLVQPITLDWNPIIDPDGPIGSYTWQVSTSSTFGTIIASESTNQWSPELSAETDDRLSGLPNGTYFWRVMGRQMVTGPAFSLESPWSAVRSFTITGLGPAPAAPTFTNPPTGSQFHTFEFFKIRWTAVPGAHYYLLEADDQPSFSHPHTLSTDSMRFGTEFRAGWGNEIPNIYYRVVAVSAGNVRGLPSATLNVKIINTAPVPAAPTPLFPNATTVSLPFTFDWTDAPNPQIPGYDIDVDDEPQFQGVFGVLMVQSISRSDYMLATDLAPGNYFWRVRAIHGSVVGPWSTGRPFTVTAAPPTPPGLGIFAIITEPGSTSGGNPTQARLIMNMPAPAGGALVKIASDLPHSETPTSVFVPAGATDAMVSPVTAVPVPGAVIGNIRAAYAGVDQQSSIGLWQILWDACLSDEEVVGGTIVTGTVTLLDRAPPGGVTVHLVCSDTSLVAPPATVFIPAGAFGATFDIPTMPVLEETRIVIDAGTPFENYRAPGAWLNLTPPGTPTPPPRPFFRPAEPARAARCSRAPYTRRVPSTTSRPRPTAARTPLWERLLYAPLMAVMAPVMLVVFIGMIPLTIPFFLVTTTRARISGGQVMARMRAAGRVTDWETIDRDLARGPGTFVWESLTLGWNEYRLWWVAEDVKLVATGAGLTPAPEDRWLGMDPENPERFPYRDFELWCQDGYADLDHGRARLVEVVHSARKRRKLRQRIDAIRLRTANAHFIAIDPPRLALGDPCPHCAYDRSGLDPTSPCPECGQRSLNTRGLLRPPITRGEP